MKNLFTTAIIALLALTSCSQKASQSEAQVVGETQAVVSHDMAYVQVEEVLAKSDLFLSEGKALQEKTQKAQTSWGQKEQSFQSEAAQLQEKYQKGLMTSADAQRQQEDIQNRMANYQRNAQKEAQSIEEQNYVFTNRAQDLMQRAVKALNTEKKYKLIVNASALIDADTTLNITPAVLAKVNELYADDKKSSKTADKK